MLDLSDPISLLLHEDERFALLLQEDSRYKFGAYVFLFNALHYAQTVLQMGAESPTEDDEPTGREHHVTGQELCEAIRRYALEQYGYMAKMVLNRWGIYKTGDFGEIVFNLIRIGQMRKTPSDAQVDFQDVYDFDIAFHQQFKIEE
jgi:uncharacterized repeat protein (TIGR04138 family)